MAYTLGVAVGGSFGVALGWYSASHAGETARSGFMTLGLLWLFSLATAVFWAARPRKYPGEFERHHQAWMVRNYALTFAAVTLRAWLGLFMGVIGPEKFASWYPSLA